MDIDDLDVPSLVPSGSTENPAGVAPPAPLPQGLGPISTAVAFPPGVPTMDNIDDLFNLPEVGSPAPVIQQSATPVQTQALSQTPPVQSSAMTMPQKEVKSQSADIGLGSVMGTALGEVSSNFSDIRGEMSSAAINLSSGLSGVLDKTSNFLGNVGNALEKVGSKDGTDAGKVPTIPGIIESQSRVIRTANGVMLPVAEAPEIDKSAAVWVHIVKTEVKLSFLMQEYTEYICEVHDFGRVRQVAHRFSDFDALHQSLAPLDLSLPALPPKGLDSTDGLVQEDRKNRLSAFLQYCLKSEVIRLEKQLHLWKFLEFENAGLSVSRFIFGPDYVRGNLFNTLPKLTTDAKYAGEVYRIAHPDFVWLCIEHVMLSEDPEHFANVALLLGGAVKFNKMQAVNQILEEPKLLPKLLGLLQKNPSAGFAGVRTLLSAILLSGGDEFASLLTPALVTAKDNVLGLLHDSVPVAIHELIAKVTWFALETDLRRFLFCEEGLPTVVALFTSSDKRVHVCACLISAVAILNGDTTGERAEEIKAKMDETWDLAIDETKNTSDDEAAMLKLASSLAHHSASLLRIGALLKSETFCQYGLWVLRKAKLNMKALQQISEALTSILEKADHPCRYHAAELLLKVQDHDLSVSNSVEGLGGFERSLERAILDPLAQVLQEHKKEIELAKTETTETVKRVERCFPGLQIGNEKFQAFEVALQSYMAVKQEVKNLVAANNRFACELLTTSKNYSDQVGSTTFSEPSRVAYVARLEQLEQTHKKAAQTRVEFVDKDAKARALFEELQVTQSAVGEVETAIKNLDSEAHQKQEQLKQLTKVVEVKKRQAGTNVDEQLALGRGRLEELQTRQKSLALCHMKLQQSENIDVEPFLSSVGKATQGSALTKVKADHQHSKLEEQKIQKQIALLETLDPEKLRSEVVKIKEDMSTVQADIAGIESRKMEMAQRVAEQKVVFESKKHLYSQNKVVRDQLQTKLQSEEGLLKNQSHMCSTEIKSRHESLAKLIQASQLLATRRTGLEKRKGAVEDVLANELTKRNELRKTITGLAAYLTELDQEIGKLGQEPQETSLITADLTTGSGNEQESSLGGEAVLVSESEVPAAADLLK